MVLQTANPFQNLLNLQQALASLGPEENWFSGSTSSRGGFPPINIFQHDDDYVVITEIPGIKKEDVNIEIHRNRVRISGEKKLPMEKMRAYIAGSGKPAPLTVHLPHRLKLTQKRQKQNTGTVFLRFRYHGHNRTNRVL